MPVPTSIDDLSQTAGSNSPAGSDSPTVIDDHIRALASFVAILRDKLDGTDNTGTVKAATFSGTHTFSSGNLISGTYTPTFTNVSGITSSTARLAQYLRVGDTVTVSGIARITADAVSTFELGISLPIASDFATGYECGGTARQFSNPSTDLTVAAISADATNNRASMTSAVGNAALAQDWAYSFTYRVV